MTSVALHSQSEAAWSFIDLKAWALEGVPPTTAAAGDAFLTMRRPLELPAGPIGIGVITLERGEGRVAGQAADEFLHVLSGGLTIDVAGRRLLLEAGRSGVIPAGADFDWRSSAPTRAIFMRHANAAAGSAPCLIDPGADRQPSGPPLAELLTTPTPQCRNHTQYASAHGAFVCGVWDSTPYSRKPMTYGHHELMHLLEGAVTFEDHAGRAATFSAGDVLLVRRGASCSWVSEVAVTKVFAIYRPA